MIFGRQITATIWMMVVMTTSWVTVAEVKNLLKNPSFEESLRGTWKRTGKFNMEQYTGDKLLGENSLRCTNRKGQLDGPAQELPDLKPGRGYEFRAYVKLLNDDPGKLWQQFKAIVKFQFKGVVNGSKDTPASASKPKSCKGLKGELRKACLVERAEWKQRMKEKRRKMKKKKFRQKNKNKKKKKDKTKKKDKMKKVKGKQKVKKGRTKQDKKGKGKKKQTDKMKKDKKKTGKAEQEDKDKRVKEEQEDKDKRVKEEPEDKDKTVREKRRASRDERHARNAGLHNIAHRLHLVTTATRTTSGRPPYSGFHYLYRGRPWQRRKDQRSRVASSMTSLKPLMTSRREAKRRSPAVSESGESTSSGSYIIAWKAFVTSKQGWVLLAGSINAPMIPFTTSSLYIRGPHEGIGFLMDNVTFYEIPERSDWLAESHVMIDRHRKSDINFRVTVPPGVSPADIDVEIQHKKHLFAFGSKVEDFVMTSDQEPWYRAYRDLFFTLFNWATIGSFKWRFDKGVSLYSPDFSNALAALEVLRKHGIKVRAHSIFWGVKKNIPDKVLNTSKEDLPRLIKFHTEYMMNITKGKVEHWDVQNELMHGHWYEETLKDPHISEKMFKMARPLDPYPKLYLNDFTAVTSGANTEELYETAMRFIKAKTGIQGLGIQAHVKDFIKPDPTMMWRRLDRLAETGLELFITEFDVGWDDEVVRADWFEDAMRAFFAHPNLGGMILWGCLKELQRYKNKYLFHGTDLKFSEQGQRWACLVKKEWTTKETFNLGEGTNFSLRGFQGDYEVLVNRSGVTVQREVFTLGKKAQTVTLNVTASKSAITLPAREHDYVPDCISHRGRASLGTKTHDGSETGLMCKTRTSAKPHWSGLNEDDTLAVSCAADEVMTACFSLSKHKANTRKGERIVKQTGTQFQCVAVQGRGAKGGVRPYARCCKVKGLSCEYMKAGPSSHFDGAKAEAQCNVTHKKVPLGCSSYSQFPDFDGAFSNLTASTCLAQSGPPTSSNVTERSGSEVYAACCNATGLKCVQKYSAESLPKKGKDVSVACDSGWVITGCNVLAKDGNAAGARIIVKKNIEQCRAYMGLTVTDEGAKGVVAVATCCKISQD